MFNKFFLWLLFVLIVVIATISFFVHDNGQKKVIKEKDVKIANLESSIRTVEDAYTKLAEKNYSDSILYNERIDNLVRKSNNDEGEIRRLIGRIKKYAQTINEKDATIATLTGKIVAAGKKIDSLTDFSTNAGEALKEIRATVRELNSQLDLVRRHAAESFSFIITTFWTPDFTEAYASIRKWCKAVPEKTVNSIYLDKKYSKLRRVANALPCTYETLYAFCVARGINPVTVSKTEIKNSIKNFLDSDYPFWGAFYQINDEQLKRIKILINKRFGL